MSSQQHQRIKQPSVEDEVDLNMCIPGLGENKIRPRVLGSSFFGYVADAYSPRTPCLPSERLMESPVTIPIYASNNGNLKSRYSFSRKYRLWKKLSSSHQNLKKMTSLETNLLILRYDKRSTLTGVRIFCFIRIPIDRFRFYVSTVSSAPVEL